VSATGAGVQSARPAREAPRDLALFVARNRGPLLALGVFAVMFSVYLHEHPRQVSVSLLTAASNKAVVLAFMAMAQTVPVLTRGLDLSIGSIMMMAACASSELVNGSPGHVAFGVTVVLMVGLAAGAINGAIVVFGRIQPIIATLATGAIYFGIALWLRPTPGGDVNEGLSNALTYATFGVPTTFLLLVAVLVFVWLPFRRSVLGRGCYAAGSAEGAAYMSGVALGRCKMAAYALAGLLAALAGLLLSLEALSGEASAPQAGAYTLNSIAAVVVDCAECQDPHYHDWALLRASLEQLLNDGRMDRRKFAHETPFLEVRPIVSQVGLPMMLREHS